MNVGCSRMPSDPTNIGHACKPVIRVHVKDILDSECSAEQVSAGGVDDALRFTRGSGGLDGAKGKRPVSMCESTNADREKYDQVHHGRNDVGGDANVPDCRRSKTREGWRGKRRWKCKSSSHKE